MGNKQLNCESATFLTPSAIANTNKPQTRSEPSLLLPLLPSPPPQHPRPLLLLLSLLARCDTPSATCGPPIGFVGAASIAASCVIKADLCPLSQFEFTTGHASSRLVLVDLICWIRVAPREIPFTCPLIGFVVSLVCVHPTPSVRLRARTLSSFDTTHARASHKLSPNLDEVSGASACVSAEARLPLPFSVRFFVVATHFDEPKSGLPSLSSLRLLAADCSSSS